MIQILLRDGRTNQPKVVQEVLDMTLACEDTNLKLVEVVTVADVDDEDRIGNSLLQIWKLSLGHKAKL